MIREATKEDVKALTLLMSELGYPTTEEKMTIRFKRIKSQSNYQTYVYEKDSRLVGMVGMFEAIRYESDDSYIRIVTMVVDSKFRGLGIGKELLIAAERWALERGASMISLNSGNREERQQAHEFYRHQGFKGTATGFYKKIKDA
ncbi:GNAT family N-acetyltransferase [Filobacillus milosensis]|uniref:GNAT family N-acetyltransferase n=1 Tax=Filobacillus milosensis TaxID=94137 RepID=A0A4Y8IL85_9BACI|nr:GNAT family N-acetyltransferase [Filobacillus milosensis]TFB21848.1 GNAT family N-acetyltransferase [Filobacillus milosensis]